MATQMQQSRFMELYNSAKSSGDPFPAISAAQTILESGWNGSNSGTNNPLGLKTNPGASGTTLPTNEQGSGGLYQTAASFQNFTSVSAAYQERLDRIRKLWPGYMTATSDSGAAAALQQGYSGQSGAYATDSKYGGKLSSILQTLGLPGLYLPQSQLLPGQSNGPKPSIGQSIYMTSNAYLHGGQPSGGIGPWAAAQTGATSQPTTQKSGNWTVDETGKSYANPLDKILPANFLAHYAAPTGIAILILIAGVVILYSGKGSTTVVQEGGTSANTN